MLLRLFDENQAMLLEIDNQRKKEDPSFKGAFHEKKNPKAAAVKKKTSLAKSGLPKSTTAKSFSSARPKNYGFAKNNKRSGKSK